MTASAWQYTSQSIRQTARQTFERQSTLVKDLIEERMQVYFDALHAGQGLFAASQSVNRAEWKAFVEALKLQQRYPGINGLGFIRYVPGERKIIYEQQVRQDTSINPDGYPNFAIKPPGIRSAYFVIEYIEPLLPNYPAFGLDVRHESRRREAAQRARDTGEIAATARIVLVQDQEKKPGLLIFLPLYKKGMPSTSVEEKRRAFVGFVYAPLKTGDLIREALAHETNMKLDLEIYENQELLYDGDPKVSAIDQKRDPLYRNIQTLGVGGQRWDLHFAANPDLLSQSQRYLPVLILSAGSLISILLATIMWSLVSSRSRALALANQITSELQQTHSFLQTVIDHLPVALFVKDTTAERADTFKLWNKTSEYLFGLAAKQTIGKTVNDCSLEEQAGFFKQQEREIFERETLEDIPEELINSHSRGQRVLHTIKVPIFDKNNNAQYLLCISEDITERKQAEEALQNTLRELEFHKLALDQSAIVAETDHRGIITYANDNFCEISKYSRDELIGQTHRLIKSDYHPPSFFKQLWSTIASGNVWRGEIKNRAKDGSYYWVDTTIVPFLDKNGKAFKYLAIRFDITQIKQTQTALQESEKRYRSVVDNLKEVIFQTDAVGLWTFLNPAWTEITGFTLEESIGTNFLNYVHPDDRQHNLELFEPLIERQKEYCRHEIRYLTKNGDFRWIEVFARLVLSEDQTIIGTAGTLNDITERKQAEEELKENEAAVRALYEVTAARNLSFEERIDRLLAGASQFGKYIKLKVDR
ncbi:PAS domain S-box protein [Microcoleus sp. T3_B1]|uniref:PAS domain S-box protein n=1 Tax=Microcoleus sp. T3_B1 TaxID=3055425 RepID=UPI002FD65C50